MNEIYQPNHIEKDAQQSWEMNRAFQATEDSTKEKYYVLAMFPYPSGHLHMGHVRNYVLGDVISRYQRMHGKNVLYPMGWDAFGLPAENAAIQRGVLPAEWTYHNIDVMRAQLKQLGLSYDWHREIATCDPNYYRWEQWFFIRLYEKGLVYRKEAEVNWDPVDQTVLANEQVIDGRGWRSGALVERRAISQWFLKITDYADELLNELDQLPDWPHEVKTMQKNWIGRSEGIEIRFPVVNQEHDALTIFTTRPDTIYGVTYIAIAPNHPLAQKAGQKNEACQAFIHACQALKMAEAEMATAEKQGIFTGFTAKHPLTGEVLPIWIANFVMMEYGTGAVMAVPAHDQRDYEFAQKYHLPIKPVIMPLDSNPWDFSKHAYTDAGELIHSEQFSGLDSKHAARQIMDWIENHGHGVRKVHFRLRDWGISRQRYWGAPIPMVECDACGFVPVLDEDLPVKLPEHVHFSNVHSPLQSMPEFRDTHCPRCHQTAKRETDTFDTFFESSWYYARFACPDQQDAILDGRAQYWLPVDQYIGGIEHAVMHLLYARFICKALRDIGVLQTNEPFTRLLTQGMVLNQGAKMSKSKGNVVPPEPLIERYGADTVRLFILFAAPPESNLEWSDSGVEGAHRFMKKIWAWAFEKKNLIKDLHASCALSTMSIESCSPSERETIYQLFTIVEQIQRDYDRLQFNTVVSGCMKVFNLLVKETHPKFVYMGMSVLLRLLAPITPHLTHVLWRDLGYPGDLLSAEWPALKRADFSLEEIQMVVQLNGKLRAHITVPHDADEAMIQEIACKHPKVQPIVSEQSVSKIIVVPKKLINIVTKNR